MAPGDDGRDVPVDRDLVRALADPGAGDVDQRRCRCLRRAAGRDPGRAATLVVAVPGRGSLPVTADRARLAALLTRVGIGARPSRGPDACPRPGPQLRMGRSAGLGVVLDRARDRTVYLPPPADRVTRPRPLAGAGGQRLGRV